MKVTDEPKQKHPSIPWRQPTSLRNRIVHGYWAIDLDILHSTATGQLPAFADRVSAVLAELEGAAAPPNADDAG